jgi:hypothetical protein
MYWATRDEGLAEKTFSYAIIQDPTEVEGHEDYHYTHGCGILGEARRGSVLLIPLFGTFAM